MGFQQTITKLNVSFVINSVQKVWTYPHISQSSDPYSCVMWLKAVDVSEAYPSSIITVEICLDATPCLPNSYLCTRPQFVAGYKPVVMVGGD
jgi:hypothetical protein